MPVLQSYFRNEIKRRDGLRILSYWGNCVLRGVYGDNEQIAGR